MSDEIRKECIKFFQSKGYSDIAISAIIGGNLEPESACNPRAVESSKLKKWGITNDEYIERVDNGTWDYTNPTGKVFGSDGCGIGLAQWSSKGRKEGLLAFCKGKNVSISDLHAQLEWIWIEIHSTGYANIRRIFEKEGGKDIDACTRIFMAEFERPANQSETNQQKRVDKAKMFYSKWFEVKKETKENDMIYSRKNAIEKMRSYLGAVQGDETHKKIVDTYNSYLPHPRNHKLTMSDAWCCATVASVGISLGYTNIIPVECSCTKMIELAKGLDEWQENDAFVPQAGDLIIYDWEDTGIGDCTGTPNHIGMVEKVENGKITVIEGNYSNRCQRRVISIDGRYIRGFVVPKYNDNDVVQTPQEQPKTNTVEYTVKSGDTLTKIANKYKTTVNDIALLNSSITDINKIRVGQKIIIPQIVKTYVVQKGDTLTKIAKKYGISYLSIALKNGIINPNKISVGQVLLIP